MAPLGPLVGIWNPRAKAPTLFCGTEIDSVTAKVGYSFSGDGMDLFNKQNSEAVPARPPLAARMRPQMLAEIAGQDHVLGPGKLLRRAIESDRLASLILYGPPGCGKTSLAEVIARVTHRHFEKTSGVLANVAVLRDLLQAAFERRRREGVQTILFLDEIHHFNKSNRISSCPTLKTAPSS